MPPAVNLMRNASFVAVALIAAMALAGCTNNPAPSGPSNAVTGVTVTGPADGSTADAGSSVVICWQVAGTGKTQHTAIHWDTTSHAQSNATFQDYQGGAVYPDNGTQADPNGYALPGSFCAAVKMPSKPLYFRAHALNPPDAPGMLSGEREVGLKAMASTVVPITSATNPSQAAPASTVQLCWSLTGAGHVKHTAIHWDTTSHAGPNATFQDYKGGTIYPNDTPQAAPAGYDAPGNFCGNLKVPATGAVYYRAHVMLPPDPPGTLSQEERCLAIAAGACQPGAVLSVDFADTSSAALNLTAPRGSNVTMCWVVQGVGTVGHTAIHGGNVSEVGNANATFASYDKGTWYPNNSTVQGPYQIQPTGTTFCTNVLAPDTAGATWYYRAHVMLPPPQPGQLSPHEASIKAS